MCLGIDEMRPVIDPPDAMETFLDCPVLVDEAVCSTSLLKEFCAWEGTLDGCEYTLEVVLAPLRGVASPDENDLIDFRGSEA